MRRAAWVNQVLAAWLIGFMVFGIGDAASAVEILSHGVAALLLLLASWRVLTESSDATVPSAIQTVAGVWLGVLPTLFRYPSHSFLALNDLTIGCVAAVDGLIEMWISAHARIGHLPVLGLPRFGGRFR